jgi:PAS domain S-box-containing protein
MHILHLEDSHPDAELIRHLLNTHWPGCRVSTLTTQEAFENAVQRGDFDLILSDYTLPGYDGLRALAFAREHSPDKPFIYISGTIGEERAIEALKAGASDYVIKDRPARLIPAIRAALTQLEQERAQRRAEEKIREQASLLDKAHEAICVTDAAHHVTYWNASAERLYGWSSDEAIGQDLHTLLYGADRPRFDAAYALVLATREWRGQLGPQTRNGESITVESSWSLMTDETGLAKSILIIDEDITERQQLEIQRMRAQRLETIGLLAGGIAHDLNNMLAPIITSIDLLRLRTTDQENRATLNLLEESAEHGADLVRQLVAFARGSEGQWTDLTVDALLDSVRRLLQRAMPPTIEIRTSFGPEQWLLHADATQLRQVFLNLCINARDAMPQGGVIEMRAKNVQVDPATTKSVQGDVKAGPYLRISVSDSGAGIPPELATKIFDPFFTTKQSGKGTGLGLANVVGIIKAHGGFLDLESTPNTGTTFHVYLPALRQQTDGRAPNLPAAAPVQGRNEHILVIEDDDAVRSVLEMILSNRDYRVAVSADGADGLALLRAQPGVFALVIMDMNMSGIPAPDLIRQVRAMLSAPKLIAVSGLSQDEQGNSELLQGIEFLQKPLVVETLLSTVRRVLDTPASSG